MDVHVGRAGDHGAARSTTAPLISPEVLDAVIAAVLAPARARRSRSESARRDEAATWTSVRDGRTR